MNVVISDTAEYGNYLFSFAAVPLLQQFMADLQPADLGAAASKDNSVDNAELLEINDNIRRHPIETVGQKLRNYMTAMKRISVAS